MNLISAGYLLREKPRRLVEYRCWNSALALWPRLGGRIVVPMVNIVNIILDR